MVPGSHDMGNLMDGYQDDCTLHGSWIQCISEGPAFSGSPNSTCIPSPLLRRKTSSPLLPMVTLHVILPPNLVLAGLPSPGSFDNSSPIHKFLLLVIIPSSLPLINDQSSPKLPLGRLPMLFMVTKHINTIISHPVCPQTVRNMLKQHSFKAVTKKKKPLLTAVHRKKQLAFALRHKKWTVEDWKRVIWSDETKFNRIGSDGKQWVGKQAGDGLIEREVQGTVKFGGGNIMVWGCMGWNGVGKLAEIEGRMDAEQYVEILDDHLLPSIEESGIAE